MSARVVSPVHLRMPDGWTVCNIGPLRRARRTTDRRKVTCGDCARLLAGG